MPPKSLTDSHFGNILSKLRISKEKISISKIRENCTENFITEVFQWASWIKIVPFEKRPPGSLEHSTTSFEWQVFRKGTKLTMFYMVFALLILIGVTHHCIFWTYVSSHGLDFNALCHLYHVLYYTIQTLLSWATLRNPSAAVGVLNQMDFLANKLESSRNDVVVVTSAQSDKTKAGNKSLHCFSSSNYLLIEMQWASAGLCDVLGIAVMFWFAPNGPMFLTAHVRKWMGYEDFENLNLIVKLALFVVETIQTAIPFYSAYCQYAICIMGLMANKIFLTEIRSVVKAILESSKDENAVAVLQNTKLALKNFLSVGMYNQLCNDWWRTTFLPMSTGFVYIFAVVELYATLAPHEGVPLVNWIAFPIFAVALIVFNFFVFIEFAKVRQASEEIKAQLLLILSKMESSGGSQGKLLFGAELRVLRKRVEAINAFGVEVGDCKVTIETPMDITNSIIGQVIMMLGL